MAERMKMKINFTNFHKPLQRQISDDFGVEGRGAFCETAGNVTAGRAHWLTAITRLAHW